MPGLSFTLYEWEFGATQQPPAASEQTFVESLVDDLHAAGLVVKGVTGFADQMLDNNENPCVMVRDLGGVPSHTPAPQMMMQFLVRGTSFEQARQKAAKVYNFYHTETDKTITGYRIISAVAEGLPTRYGEDGRQRHLVGFNMVFKAHATSQGSSEVGFGGKRDPNEA